MANLSNRIMVVDDDEGVLDSFEALLGDRFELVKAESGYEALRILESETPRLIFLDIKMPGMNGIDLLKRIREEEREVKVVIITALVQEKIEEEAKSLGIYDYLKKPLDIFKIERITSQILS